ncbi:MAG: PAS domain S-box protein [Candidatus Melainabacteria bacterium]|nr:PAS domain S-box protein [Candidatus Melainabacteria bacterium]
MPAAKPSTNLTIAQKGLILIGVPLVFEIIFLATLWVLLEQSEIEVRKEIRARRINAATSMMARHMLDFIVGSVGYGFTRTDTFNDHYKNAVRDLPAEADRLIRMLADQPEKQEKARFIKENFEIAIRKADDIRIKIENDEMDKVMVRLPGLQNLAQEASVHLHELASDQSLAERESLNSQNQLRVLVKLCLILGVALNLALSLIILAWFSRSITKRLQLIADNSDRVARGQSLNPSMEGSDEIARLDRAIHAMADSISTLTKRERALIENAEDVICSIDRSGKILSANPAALPRWGYEAEDLTGARLAKITTQEDFDRFQKALSDQFETGSAFPLEIRLTHRDSSEIDTLWSAQWSDQDNCFICICHDVTWKNRSERLIRAAEARFRSIIENLPIGLLICNERGFVELANPCLTKMFAVSKAPIGIPLARLLTDNSEEQSNLQFNPEDLLAESIECSMRKEDGSNFPAEISCHKIGGEFPDPASYLVLIADITHKAEIEKLKQEFIMILSHELRTPLTSLSMLLELLFSGAYGDLNEKGQSKVQVAKRNITRLVKLIQELLDFETIEANKLEMETGCCHLTDTLEKALEASRGPAVNKKIDLVADFHEITVNADSDRLVQVLINLIANAIKYSPEGEIITISSRIDGEFARVSVSDRGPGIEKEHRLMIFERFKQVDPAASKGKGNIGLGLAISKAIIDRHGGVIGVDSEPGKGSTFWFTVPLWSEKKP